MDISATNEVRDKLFKSNPVFRELVQKHQNYEQRLDELAHLTYPNDDEMVEETTLKKKKLLVKDEIYAILEKHSEVNSH